MDAMCVWKVRVAAAKLGFLLLWLSALSSHCMADSVSKFLSETINVPAASTPEYKHPYGIYFGYLTDAKVYVYDSRPMTRTDNWLISRDLKYYGKLGIWKTTIAETWETFQKGYPYSVTIKVMVAGVGCTITMPLFLEEGALGNITKVLIDPGKDAGVLAVAYKIAKGERFAKRQSPYGLKWSSCVSDSSNNLRPATFDEKKRSKGQGASPSIWKYVHNVDQSYVITPPNPGPEIIFHQYNPKPERMETKSKPGRKRINESKTNPAISTDTPIVSGKRQKSTEPATRKQQNSPQSGTP